MIHFTALNYITCNSVFHSYTRQIVKREAYIFVLNINDNY